MSNKKNEMFVMRPQEKATYRADAEDFENGNTFGAYEHYLCGIIWQIFGLLMNRSPKKYLTIFASNAARIFCVRHA